MRATFSKSHYGTACVTAMTRKSPLPPGLVCLWRGKYMLTMVISIGDAVREFQLTDAKAGLSSITDAAARGDLSIISRHGKPEAVVLGFKEWERLGRLA